MSISSRKLSASCWIQTKSFNCNNDISFATFLIRDPLMDVLDLFFLLFSSFNCALSVTLHMTHSGVSLPVAPQVLISCWELLELDKGAPRGPD